MKDEYFYAADAEMLYMSEQGALRPRTEFGIIDTSLSSASYHWPGCDCADVAAAETADLTRLGARPSVYRVEILSPRGAEDVAPNDLRPMERLGLEKR